MNITIERRSLETVEADAVVVPVFEGKREERF